MTLDPFIEIQRLQREVEDLRVVVRELTAALRIMTEKDERAKQFVARVEELLD